jgi:hypothetical protein
MWDKKRGVRLVKRLQDYSGKMPLPILRAQAWFFCNHEDNSFTLQEFSATSVLAAVP